MVILFISLCFLTVVEPERTSIVYSNTEDRLKTSDIYKIVSPTPTYSPTSPTSTQFSSPSSSSSVVTYIPDSTQSSSRQPTEKQDTTFGLKITVTTIQPSRTVPVFSTSSVTWPLTNISDKHHPSWTPPPLEIIPANDYEDPLNHLEESPSNRIPNYEEAPNKLPDSQPPQKQPSSEMPTSHFPKSNSPSTNYASNKPTQDTPIITVNDNDENEIPHFHRNEKGGVKYGHKHEGKSLSSAQAKLNMGMKENFCYLCLCIDRVRTLLSHAPIFVGLCHHY